MLLHSPETQSTAKCVENTLNHNVDDKVAASTATWIASDVKMMFHCGLALKISTKKRHTWRTILKYHKNDMFSC